MRSLINNKFIKNVSRKFKAEINILHHTTTIRDNYQPVLHCGPIRQVAVIKILDEQVDKDKQIDDKDKQIDDNETDNKKLRTGSKAIVEFTFSYRSEYLEEGLSFFFRDGSTKGYGKILEIL